MVKDPLDFAYRMSLGERVKTFQICDHDVLVDEDPRAVCRVDPIYGYRCVEAFQGERLHERSPDLGAVHRKPCALGNVNLVTRSDLLDTGRNHPRLAHEGAFLW